MPDAAGRPVIHAPDPSRLERLRGLTVAVVGYGNQGRAQALNLRDSGVRVRVGNRDDSYAATAEADGFAVLAIREAVHAADVVALLVPDAVQPEIFDREVAPALRADATLVVASGYGLYYDLIGPPDGGNAVMVAPRMVGENVRIRYLDGTGSPSFLSVEQDGAGDATAIALAYAEAIGCTRGGCFASSSREEVALDLFGEQALWPAILHLVEIAYDVLVEQGLSELATIYELYLSGEPAEIFSNAARLGLLGQLSMHSPASQIGQLAGSLPTDATDSVRTRFREVLGADILAGGFVRSWHADGPAAMEQRLVSLRADVSARPMHVAEQRVRAITCERVNGRNP